MKGLGQYSKTIAALVTAVLGWAAVVIASPAHAITASEYLMLGVGGATALGVYGVSNSPAPTPAPVASPVVSPAATP